MSELINLDKILLETPSAIATDFVTQHELTHQNTFKLNRDADVIITIHIQIKRGCHHVSAVKQFGQLKLFANNNAMFEVDSEILGCKYTNGEDLFRMPIGPLAMFIIPYAHLSLDYNNSYYDNCDCKIREELVFMPSVISDIIMSYKEPCAIPKATVYFHNYHLDKHIRQKIMSKRCFCTSESVKKQNTQTQHFDVRAKEAYVVKGNLLGCTIITGRRTVTDLSILRQIYGAEMKEGQIYKPAGKLAYLEPGSEVIVFEHNTMIYEHGCVRHRYGS